MVSFIVRFILSTWIVGPRVFYLRQTVRNIVFGQYCMDFIGNDFDQASKELHCDYFALLLMKLDIGEFSGPIDGDKRA